MIGVAKNSSLTKLKLRTNRIGLENLIILGQEIAYHGVCKLQELNLEDNRIHGGGEGGVGLAKAVNDLVTACPSLTYCNVLFNFQYSQEREDLKLIDMVRDNNVSLGMIKPSDTRLKFYLDFSLEQLPILISDLSKEMSTSLRWLDLSASDLREKILELEGFSIDKFANILKHHKSLTCCNLLENEFSEDDVDVLIRAVEEKGMSLCNIEYGNPLCVFEDMKFGVADLILLTADLLRPGVVGKSLTSLRFNEVSFEATILPLVSTLKNMTAFKKIEFVIARFHNDNEDETNALIKGLLENRWLTELRLQWSYIGPRGANTIAEALLKNDSLTSLDLSENRLSDGEFQFVPMTRVQVGGRQRNPSLKVGDRVIYQGREMIITTKHTDGGGGELNLKPVSPDLSGINSICNALRVNRTLKSLNLSVLDLSTYDEEEMSKQTSVGKAGASALYRILSQNRSLTSLKFVNNNVGVYDFFHTLVGDALKVNPVLRSLDLDRNNIGLRWILPIAEALKHNTVLEHLNLANNFIRNEGANALADALDQNRSLKSLDVSNNEIGATGTEHIARGLRTNRSLTSLKLENNPITTSDGGTPTNEGVHAIVDALRNNPSMTELHITLPDLRLWINMRYALPRIRVFNH